MVSRAAYVSVCAAEPGTCLSVHKCLQAVCQRSSACYQSVCLSVHLCCMLARVQIAKDYKKETVPSGLIADYSACVASLDDNHVCLFDSKGMAVIKLQKGTRDVCRRRSTVEPADGSDAINEACLHVTVFIMHAVFPVFLTWLVTQLSKCDSAPSSSLERTTLLMTQGLCQLV